MSLQKQISEQVKQAMIAKDALKLNVLRGLLAGFTNELVAQKKKPQEEISDEDAMRVISRAVKQRKDSIEQFTAGGRPELAKNEAKELKILEVYLPATMSKADIKKVVTVKMSELKITDKSGAGKLMGAVSKELKGKADGADIKSVVDELLK